MGNRHHRTYLILAALACRVALAAGPPPDFKVGAGTHFGPGKGVVSLNLDLARQAGINAIRDSILWQQVEKEKGRLEIPPEYDAYINGAIAQGIDPLPILGGNVPFYENGSDRPRNAETLEGLARFAEFVVRHFKGKVHSYEIWNEWDAPSRQNEIRGTAEGYVAVLTAMSARMKAVDPSIVVYGGAMTSKALGSGWMEEFLRAGALDHCDAVSIHTYRNLGGPFRERGPESWAEWMTKANDLVKKYSGSRDVPIYVTEMGWPNQINPVGIKPEVTAAYLARMYLLARTLPFLKGIWWYDFQDDGWDFANRENNFGLLRADLTPKPAYFAMAAVAGLAAKADYLGRIDVGDPDIWILKFRSPNGKYTWSLWSAHEDDNWQITLEAKQPHAVEICQIGATPFRREWGTRAWAKDAPVLPNQMSIVVRDMPWLITGDLSTVTVKGVERREYPELKRPPRPQP